jgi:branched-chain amino acid transport system permease protein
MTRGGALHAARTGRIALGRGDRVWLGAVLVLAAVLALYPLWTDDYSLASMRDVLLFGLFALSLDYFWGRTGILSFGQATFFGFGAYGMAVLTVKLQPDPAIATVLGLVGGIGIAGLVALIVGYFLIFGGVRGAYFTIVTLALTIIAQHIAVGWSSVTGGDAGLIGVPPLGISVGGFTADLADPRALYYAVLVLCLLCLLVLWGACRGRYGQVLTAIQDNELRARTLGHNTSLHLLAVFVLSAMLAALAGAIYATGTGFVAPDMIGLLLSTEVIMWVAVGGRGTFLGPFIGTFVIWNLQQEVSSIDTKLWPLSIGLFFIAMVFLFPDGVVSVYQRLQALRHRWRDRRSRGGT